MRGHFWDNCKHCNNIAFMIYCTSSHLRPVICKWFRLKGLSHFMRLKSSENLYLEPVLTSAAAKIMLIFSGQLCHSSIKPGKRHLWIYKDFHCFSVKLFCFVLRSFKQQTQLNMQVVTGISNFADAHTALTYNNLCSLLKLRAEISLPAPPLHEPCHNPRLLNPLVHFRPW